jgi:uncharacterized membrane protein
MSAANLRARLLRFWREEWLTLLIVAALGVGYLALRTNPTAIVSAEALVESLAQGQPTVVEFYSNA